MSKKNMGLWIEIEDILDRDNTPFTPPYFSENVKDLYKLFEKQLAKEKMELVERIEAKLREARGYYADNAQYARDNVKWIAVVEALDGVISALKSEEK